jgi:hypothetical protein
MLLGTSGKDIVAILHSSLPVGLITILKRYCPGATVSGTVQFISLNVPVEPFFYKLSLAREFLVFLIFNE